MKAFVFDRTGDPNDVLPYKNCRNRNPVQVKFSSACDFRRFILATCTSCAAVSVVSRRYQPVPASSASVSSRRLGRALQVPHLARASFF